MQQVIARVAIEQAGGRTFFLSLTGDEADRKKAEPPPEDAGEIGSR